MDIRSALIPALVLVAGFTPAVLAQDEAPAKADIRVERPRTVDPAAICPPSASRTKSCERQPEQAAFGIQKEFLTTIEVPSQESLACQATIALEYTQRNTLATVEGTIENGDCAASSGDYVLAVRVRDENGELKTLEFDEAWRRDDDQAVKFKADYEIGPNVDLVNVRTRRLQCSCASPAESAPSAEH